VGLIGILLGLALLVWLAYRGWSILLLAPGAALIAAAFAGGPLLAYWTQTFMDSASRFIAQFFPLFLLGALFGKLMEDSGSVLAIAQFMTERLGPARAILTVVLAGAFVTYGGVSLFVAFFVLVPMAQALFRSAGLSVCGGWDVPPLQPASRGRAMAQPHPLRLTRPLKTRRCASAPRPRANSILPRSVTASRAAKHRRSAWLRCRSS